MRKRTTIAMLLPMFMLVGGLSLALAGCESAEKAEDHPQGEHPQGEHPEGEHPEGEHPTKEEG